MSYYLYEYHVTREISSQTKRSPSQGSSTKQALKWSGNQAIYDLINWCEFFYKSYIARITAE